MKKVSDLFTWLWVIVDVIIMTVLVADGLRYLGCDSYSGLGFLVVLIDKLLLFLALEAFEEVVK